MSPPRRLIYAFVAIFLIGGTALVAYKTIQGSAEADISGGATARVDLEISAPNSASTVVMTAAFAPVAGGESILKEKEVSLKSGTTSYSWKIKDLPEGRYNVTLSCPGGTFTPQATYATLKANQNNFVGEFKLSLEI